MSPYLAGSTRSQPLDGEQTFTLLQPAEVCAFSFEKNKKRNIKLRRDSPRGSLDAIANVIARTRVARLRDGHDNEVSFRNSHARRKNRVRDAEIEIDRVALLAIDRKLVVVCTRKWRG